MRQFLTFLLIVMLAPYAAKAEKWTSETIPMVHLQDARRYVCNPDGVMSQAAADSTDKILFSMERDKGVQTVVVAVRQIAGGDAYQFGMELGRKYGIGSKSQRTGLIIILSTEDRRYQILTGNGLEGTLPDAICRRIENRVMVPLLKAGDWDTAILSTVKSIDSYVRADSSLKAEGQIGDDDASSLAGLALAMLFLIFFLGLSACSVRRHKCPHCKQAQMRVARRQRIKTGSLAVWRQRVTYRCPRCGYEKVVYEDDSNFNGDTVVPPVLMGGFGRGGMDGGFSPGSFGGGTFGGGGSGGSF